MFNIFLISVFLRFAFAREYDGSVIEVKNFEDDVLNADQRFHLKPILGEAAASLASENIVDIIAKVDCTSETLQSRCTEQGVSGYPTLKFVTNGKFEDVNIDRSKEAIIKFIKHKLLPPFEHNPTKEALLNEYHIIAYGKETDDFKNFAKEYRDYYKLGLIDDEKSPNKGKLIIYQPINFQNKLQPKTYETEYPIKKSKMESFVNDHLPALADVRDRDNIKLFTGHTSHCVVYFAIDYAHNAKYSNFWRNRVVRALNKAQVSREQTLVGISDLTTFEDELTEFGFDMSQVHEPGVNTFELKPYVGCFKDGKKYKMEGEFSEAAFQEFMTEFLAGKITPYLKSQPIAEDEGHVKVVVGINFDDVVRDSTKDVLIEFYAPWCGHCKKLTPIYAELAEKLKDESEIVISKMDATANDVPSDFDVKGFPTLYFVPAGEGSKPVRYEGAREVNDFIKFIAKHATNELKGYDRKGKPKKAEL